MSYRLNDAKDPDDIDDFTMPFSLQMATGETVSSASVTVTNATLVGSATIASNQDVIARISGGTIGTDITVLYRATTSTGRQLDATGTIRVKAR
jgi:hypothetical protein